MFEVISLIISLAAFVISALTAWLTWFQRGTVKMVQPRMIFIGHEAPTSHGGPRLPKVSLISFVYATSQRGRIVDSMYVRLGRTEVSWTFSFWAYAYVGESLARGGGLFVDRSGVGCTHQFLRQADDATFQFLPGECDLEVYALLVGDDHAIKLFSTRLTISDQDAEQLQSPDLGIYFDWRPESRSYHQHVRSINTAQQPSAVRAFGRSLSTES